MNQADPQSCSLKISIFYARLLPRPASGIDEANIPNAPDLFQLSQVAKLYEKQMPFSRGLTDPNRHQAAEIQRFRHAGGNNDRTI